MSEREIEGEEQEKAELSEPDGDQPDIEPPEEILRERTHEKLRRALCKIGKTADGCGHAFTELRLEKANVSELYNILYEYQHLRKVFLADNMLRDASSVTWIRYLTHLDLTNNSISSLEAFNHAEKLEFLEELNLSKNSLRRLEPIALRSLKRLNLNRNNIDTCEDFRGHLTLEVLELRKNKLTRCRGLSHLPALTALHLAENRLVNFEDLSDLPQLKKLNVRKNDTLDSFGATLPQLPLLNKINLSETKIQNLREIERLKAYNKSLTSLNVTGTPLAEELGDPLKKETLMLLPQLKRLNKEPVEQEEVDEALKELQERREEEEKKRLEEEEARRQAQEVQENPDQEEQQE